MFMLVSYEYEFLHIKIPCSVKTYGNLRIPPQLEVPIGNFKLVNSFLFLFTALFKFLFNTPYKVAKSLSNITSQLKTASNYD